MLASSFENFRDTALRDFHIAPPHYMTGPGPSFAAVFYMLSIDVELFCEIDKLMMIEKGIRGGFTTVAKCYVKANNPSVPDYDGGEQSHLLYFDFNNLYGFAMCQKIPRLYYKWFNFSNDEQVLRRLEHFNDYEYTLEIDLEYPRELHDDHYDFPLAPHKMKVTNDMFSPYTKRIVDQLDTRRKRLVTTEKLVTTFLKRER
jgi:hypothetical protein